MTEISPGCIYGRLYMYVLFNIIIMISQTMLKFRPSEVCFICWSSYCVYKDMMEAIFEVLTSDIIRPWLKGPIPSTS